MRQTSLVVGCSVFIVTMSSSSCILSMVTFLFGTLSSMLHGGIQRFKDKGGSKNLDTGKGLVILEI